MNKFTKEEKKAYFATISQKWADAKKKVEEKGEDIVNLLAKVAFHYPSVSATSIVYCYDEMTRMWLDGLPCVDMKTFDAWKAVWLIVKKWEHSRVQGVTWIASKDKDDKSTMFPKLYNLFHKSQVA